MVCALLAAGVLAAGAGRSVMGQDPFEREPINYSSSAAQDAITELQRRLDQSEAKLEFTPQHGYLESVLRELGVSPSSQMLVFSKTSFQQRRISPWTPRALYFNDKVYVGWVPDGVTSNGATVDFRQAFAAPPVLY